MLDATLWGPNKAHLPRAAASLLQKPSIHPTEGSRMLFIHRGAQLSPTFFLTADNQQSWANNSARIIYSMNFDSLPTSCLCFSQRSCEIIQRKRCPGLRLSLTPPVLHCWLLAYAREMPPSPAIPVYGPGQNQPQRAPKH